MAGYLYYVANYANGRHIAIANIKANVLNLNLTLFSEVAKPRAYTATKYSNQSIILSSLLSVKDGRVEN